VISGHGFSLPWSRPEGDETSTAQTHCIPSYLLLQAKGAQILLWERVPGQRCALDVDGFSSSVAATSERAWAALAMDEESM
jgi:hypothetical protein